MTRSRTLAPSTLSRVVATIRRPLRTLGVGGVLTLLFMIAIQAAPAFAATGPYADTAGVGTSIQSGSGSGSELAGAIDSLRRFWGLPVLTAVSGIAVVIGVIALISRGGKHELIEKVLTIAVIGFVGSGFSSLVVAGGAAYAAHLAGAVIR